MTSPTTTAGDTTMSAITVWNTADSRTDAGEQTSIFAGVRTPYLVLGLIGWGAFAVRLVSTFTL
jgi:hypothetical protein